MNEIITKENIKIEDMIYEIRGKQVMLDRDLGILYKCTNGTKDINKAVSRNIDKFPEDFCFQITKEEYEEILRFQNGTSSYEVKKHHGGIRYLPHVFTEEGVAMLSSVLKTEVASKVSVNIMRAFVVMRKYISNDILTLNNHSNMLIDHEERIKNFRKHFLKV